MLNELEILENPTLAQYDLYYIMQL